MRKIENKIDWKFGLQKFKLKVMERKSLEERQL